MVDDACLKSDAGREAFDRATYYDLGDGEAVIDTPAILAACEAAVWAVANASEAYDCTEVAKRTYSAEEVDDARRKLMISRSEAHRDLSPEALGRLVAKGRP